MSDGPATGGTDLFDELPCGVAVTNNKGTILRANVTLCGWLGCDAASLVNQKKLQELFTMGGRIFHQTHWLPLIQMQGSVSEVKFDVRRFDGVVLPMMVNAVRKKQGEAWIDIVSLTVAEERNKYERELIAARQRADALLEKERAAQLVLEDRALFAEQMIGIVSHDLRNPLSAILGGASLLQRKDLAESKREKLVATVLASARSARTLIEDLLDFTVARIGRGLAVSREHLDLHGLVAREVDGFALAFPDRTVRHLSSGEGVSSVDGARLAQLLGNLVGNAMAYGDAARPVTVTSELTPTRVRLSVHNFGVPIAESMLPRMFEPMVRGDPADASRRSVGLGLYIVRAIATAHGGDVTVASNRDEGTTFSFTCPRN